MYVGAWQNLTLLHPKCLYGECCVGCECCRCVLATSFVDGGQRSIFLVSLRKRSPPFLSCLHTWNLSGKPYSVGPGDEGESRSLEQAASLHNQEKRAGGILQHDSSILDEGDSGAAEFRRRTTVEEDLDSLLDETTIKELEYVHYFNNSALDHVYRKIHWQFQ